MGAPRDFIRAETWHPVKFCFCFLAAHRLGLSSARTVRAQWPLSLARGLKGKPCCVRQRWLLDVVGHRAKRGVALRVSGTCVSSSSTQVASVKVFCTIKEGDGCGEVD